MLGTRRCLRASGGGATRARVCVLSPVGRLVARQQQQLRPAVATAAAADQQQQQSPSGPAASPFASASVHRQVGADDPSAGPPALSIAAVDACLDEVRPYLIADGGDVEVVSAADGRVELRLRGACSSCASSDATMRMGLERAIRARFGAGVEVAQVTAGGGEDGASASGPEPASVEAVDGHLNMLRTAVASLGGRVRVAALSPATGDKGGQKATVYYKGPRSIGNGIRAAILERFPGDVVEIDMVDFPPGQEE